MDFDEMLMVRPSIESDLPFVFSTWLKGLRFGCEWFEDIESRSYFTNYHKVIETILSRPGVEISLAVFKDDPNTILGYSVHQTLGEKKILHWVFTKKSWRKTGIAKRLVPANITQCSHLTKLGKAIKPAPWVFDPFEL
jgi:hypothetical protein